MAVVGSRRRERSSIVVVFVTDGAQWKPTRGVAYGLLRPLTLLEPPRCDCLKSCATGERRGQRPHIPARREGDSGPQSDCHSATPPPMMTNPAAAPTAASRAGWCGESLAML